MIELIRNCIHCSEIATYLETDAFQRKHIIKTSTSKSGIKEIENEVEGWHFYQQRRYPSKENPLCTIIQRNKCYMKIKIGYIEGIKPNYRYGLAKNCHILKQIVDHYCNIWPYSPNNRVPIHGDLSIEGNIIINEDGIHIIDWEHFNVEGAPWGYDLVYCLLEALYFSMRGRCEPNQDELNIITENLKIIISYRPLSLQIIQHPLLFINNFIISNSRIWNEQIDKFPLLKIGDNQRSRIDNLIYKKLCSV